MSTLANSAGTDTPKYTTDTKLYDDLCQSRKRPRLADATNSFLQKRSKRQSYIDALPEECLFEILRRLPGGRDRSVSACVSKRWLAILAAIRPSEIPSKTDNFLKKEAADEENAGCLTRCLGAREVTDIRLASLAVGTAGRGGLGKLLIRGSHSTRGATDLGISAIAHGCPSLRVLSIWNVPLVGDNGLSEIASGCPLLEKLDIQECPLISDKALIAISEKCPNLTSLTVDSCFRIGDEGLGAIGRLCLKLETVSITNCPLVGDQGIASLMRSASSTLAKLKLNNLNITDLSLACIGYYGKTVTDLQLAGLENVAERGFWVMGNALGLKKLRSIDIAACRGVTDISLGAIAKGCPSLKQLCLHKCSYPSDVGLKVFAGAAKELESLQLEECHRITLVGVLGSLDACKGKIKTLSLAKCLGVRDINSPMQSLPVCSTLRSLTIRDCPGLTSSSLVVIGDICPNLVKLDLSGLVGISDVALLPLIKNSKMGMVKISLNGCVHLTDSVICTLVKLNGTTLQELHLGGCDKLTDKTLMAIADSCCKLVELDMSRSAITDYGVALLASARQFNLQLLSLGGCSKLTKKSLPLLGNVGSTLVALNLLHCNRIGNHRITSLEEKMWWCDILS